MNPLTETNKLLDSPIVDSFGRVHDSLRISVTDRCNIRCFYCMPENVKFLPQRDVLSFEEIHRVVSVSAKMGVKKIRLTGGEPLVRSQLSKLIQMIDAIDGIEDIALTTNGILLAEQAKSLKEAGLNRLNVSLDSLDADMFEKVTRRKGLDKVLSGISRAQEVGFQKIRVNAVSIKGLTESEIVPMARYAREHQLELRFIEFMPLDGDDAWNTKQVLTGESVQEIIEREVGKLRPAKRLDPQQPAVDFEYQDGRGRVGFINSVSKPFCSNCNRMRMTAEGKFRNCLFSTVEWDLRELLRGEASDEELAQRIRGCVSEKKLGHGIDTEDFQRPAKAMYQIGG
jgi:cyclic pyranopterin phosphate synthase